VAVLFAVSAVVFAHHSRGVSGVRELDDQEREMERLELEIEKSEREIRNAQEIEDMRRRIRELQRERGR